MKDNQNGFLIQSICNPALFTVLDLRSTIFSQGKIIVENISDPNNPEVIPDDPFIKLINDPYVKTSRQDFLYKHLWFKSLGNNYTRKILSGTDPNNIDSVNALYNLIPENIDWNEITNLDKFLITEEQKRQYNEQKIKYDFNGNCINIPLNQLVAFYDVTNALLNDGQLMQSPSRLQGLQGVLDNVMENIKTKGINLNFSSKYLATNETVTKGITTPLDEDDKQEVEETLYNKSIMATNAALNVQSLAADFRKLMLGDLFAEDYFTIARAYNVPREVAEAWLKSGGTFENQEKSFVKWVQSSVQFEGDDFTDTYQADFKYLEQNKRIKMSWDHLPMMASVHKEEEEAFQSFVQSYIDLVNADIYTAQEAREKIELRKEKLRL